MIPAPAGESSAPCTDEGQRGQSRESFQGHVAFVASTFRLILLAPAPSWPWEELGGAALAGGVPGIPADPGSDLVSLPLCPSPSKHDKRRQRLRLKRGNSNPIPAKSRREKSPLQIQSAGAARAIPQGVEEAAFSLGHRLPVLLELCAELILGAACAGAT